jgi:hypothetical protein
MDQPTCPTTTPDRSPSPRRPRLALRIVKLALLAVVVYYVGRALISRVDEVAWSEVTFRPGVLALSITALVTGRCLAAWAYRTLLSAFAHPLPWPAVIAVTWIPPLGKYMPGKVASMAGAVWLLNRNGVPAATGASITLTQNAMSLLLGLMIAGPLTLTKPIIDILPRATLVCATLVLAIVVCLHPRVFARCANIVLRRMGRPSLPRLPHAGQYLVPLLLILATWLVTGTGLLLMVMSLTDVARAAMPIVICTQALAMTVGFLAFFAPAGIAVREGILLLLLEPIIGSGFATIVAVAMRVVQTLVEIILALIATAVLAWRMPKPPDTRVGVASR